jgi:hypothetical protein
MAHYEPNVIAIEDTQGSRRGPRVKALTQEIIALALDENIKVKQFSRKQVNLELFRDEHGTKHALAEYIATCFPEETGLPITAKASTLERYQMDIFVAVALALVFRVKANRSNCCR